MCTPKRSWLLTGIVALLLACHGAAWAQADVLARLDTIHLLAEQNNAQALQQIRALGDELGADAPYAVRRAYLARRIELELDSGESAIAGQASTSIAQLHTLAKAQADDAGVALAMAFESAAMLVSAQPAAAVARLEEALPLALRTADPAVLWQHYLVLSNAQLNLGQFERALDSSIKCLQYADQQTRHGKPARLRALSIMSSVYLVMKNHERALAVLNQALALARELDSHKMQAMLLLNLGAEYGELGRDKESEAASQQALQISQRSGLLAMEGMILNNLGDGYLRSHDYVKAEAYARRALANARTRDRPRLAATAQANIGLALLGQGRVAQGTAEVRAALQHMHDTHDKVNQEGVLAELGTMYERLGLYREALASVREQQQLSAELFRADREKAVAALQEQFNAAQREKQITLLDEQNKLKDAELRNQRLKQAVTLLGALVAAAGGAIIFWLYRRLRGFNATLRQANVQLEVQAVHDPLTGLFNRRAFIEQMGKRDSAAAAGRRDDEPPDGLLMLDIDHFKDINDTLGHATGDAVLVEIAQRLRDVLRQSDMVTRWGGEEFLVYAPKTDAKSLKLLVQRVLLAVGATPMVVGENSLTVTVTGGFLTVPFSGPPENVWNWEAALRIADKAMYLGKLNGRNRACGVERLLVPLEQAMPAVEHDITEALQAHMLELVEVTGAASQASLPLEPSPPVAA